MSMYPSLEDMEVDKLQRAQAASQQATVVQQHSSGATTTTNVIVAAPSSGLYPSLDDYMGLDLVPYQQPGGGAVVPAATASDKQIAPISGAGNVGIRRAEIKQGIREVTLCKDGSGKVGMCVEAINKGVFVCFVKSGSAAALGGLRFGDQILSVNGELLAGYSNSKATKVIKKAPAERVVFAVRDRPFERTITMQKDSTGHVGFLYRNAEIHQIVKDSSAARNGILTEHFMLEVNGQNVVGMKDKDIKQILEVSPRTLTITVMPKFVYKHMMDHMGSSLKKQMDHSVPDL